MTQWMFYIPLNKSSIYAITPKTLGITCLPLLNKFKKLGHITYITIKSDQ